MFNKLGGSEIQKKSLCELYKILQISVLKIREISGRKFAKYERLNMLTGTQVLTVPHSTGFFVF